MTEKFQGRECIILWEMFGKLFYFINYNYFDIFERARSNRVRARAKEPDQIKREQGGLEYNDWEF